jgi:uncharacterized SAM-binding protein YcdF (DUF218 family)
MLLFLLALLVAVVATRSTRTAVCLLLLAVAAFVVFPPSAGGVAAPPSRFLSALSAPFTCIHLHKERDASPSVGSTSLRDSLDGARGHVGREGSCAV